MPIRERIKIFRSKIETLEEDVNNFLANSEEIDDLVDVKIIEMGSNNTAVALVIYRKKDEGAFSFG